MKPAATPPSRRNGLASEGDLLLYGSFFLIGIAAVLLGPLIPELRARWHLSAADAATLFLPFFVASAVGSVVSTFHLRRSVILGYGSAAVGVLALPLAGWPLSQGVVTFIGLGIGLASPAINVLVAQRHPTRRGAALTIVNLMWGLGAVSCPLIFAALLWAVPYEGILGGLGLLLTIATVLLWRSPGLAEASPASRPATTLNATTGSRSEAPWLLLLAAMFFLYVGAETALGGWLVSLAGQLGNTGTTVSMLIGAGFWGAFLTGRALTPLVLRRLPESTVYVLALTIATLGTTGVFLAPTRELLALTSAMTGFGLSPLYPLTAAMVTARTSRGAGWVFALGGFGGAVLPWITGKMTLYSGDLRQGFLVPLGALLVLAVLFALFRRTTPRGPRPSAS